MFRPAHPRNERPAATAPLGEYAASGTDRRPSIDDRKSAAIARAGEEGGGFPADLHIGSFGLARQLLRSGAVRQAGFKAELVERFTSPSRRPVLFQEGEPHQKQRSATARFFAPKVVGTRYRALMERSTEDLLGRFRATSRAELDGMSLELAVAVAAEVVGLTESARPGMADRLGRFFADTRPRRTLWSALVGFVLGQARMISFHRNDVKPAIRAHRRVPREDLISHLIQEGYSDREILTECMTYAAAGMATTREFIVMAAWHLFERDDLRGAFLEGGDPAKLVILDEILRLEPVVGTLYRRAERAFSLEDNGTRVDVPAGAVVAVDLRAANTDAAVAGRCPFSLDPTRKPDGSKPPGSLMSFGDGPHRCPGASVAMQETAIFLDRLLRMPGVRLDRAPSLSWNPLIAGYELRGAVVAIG